ncbi:MAG: phage terminase small subunit-related protein [Clostridiaceae bacterium]|nr:phage terminase small subunit-related protein [Clostridiaceae bacterium]
MPRAPSEKMIEAEKLFNEGMAMVEIAKKLGISAGTVRSWKNRYGWGDKSKKNKCNVAKKTGKKNATLQKKKRGGQPGNKNAKGGAGNPNPKQRIPPGAALKHGGYVPVFLDALDEDEQELIATVPEDTEQQLMEQIQLFSIRERRILKAINKYRNQNGDVAVADVTRFEDKRTFKDEEEEEEYNRRRKEKVDNGDILPGKSYNMQTHTTNKDMVIARLEQELSTIQSKKTKAIEALSKYRMEKARLESESAGNDAVDDWIAAVLGEDVSDYE